MSKNPEEPRWYVPNIRKKDRLRRAKYHAIPEGGKRSFCGKLKKENAIQIEGDLDLRREDVCPICAFWYNAIYTRELTIPEAAEEVDR